MHEFFGVNVLHTSEDYILMSFEVFLPYGPIKKESKKEILSFQFVTMFFFENFKFTTLPMEK